MKKNNTRGVCGRWIGPVLLVALMAGGCNTGQRLFIAEQKDMVNIRQPYQNEKKNGVDTAAMEKVITKVVENKIRKGDVAIMQLDSATSEYYITQNLDEVQVVAKSKSVPERNGEVSIDFIIRIPKIMMKTDWNITVSPIMVNGDRKIKLDSINIRGRENSAFNERMAVYKERAAKRWENTTEHLEGRTGLVFSARNRRNQKALAHKRVLQVEEEIAKKGWGLRLDTVIQADEQFFYYYNQSFPALDLEPRLQVAFNAHVTNCAGDRYAMEQGDTLVYNISSMMQFLDRTPRYKRYMIQRRVTDSATANIVFNVGQSAILDTLGDNRTELRKIAEKIEELNKGNEFVIDSIVMTAYCSPEGSEAANRELAKNRAKSLQQYLKPVISTNAMAEDLLVVKWSSEDWDRTRELIAKDDAILNKTDILRIIDTQKNLDTRENQIRSTFPTEYEHIRRHIYPQVRSVDFRFYLARRNMVEEFMYTDVIDTLYADALKLMDKRRYKEAMPKLLEYEDWNTAVCYMSLGYDGSAWNILINLPKTSDRQYLMAILAARMGRKEMAMQLYQEACKMDESKVMRGELDPEISKLIKEFGVNNK